MRFNLEWTPTGTGRVQVKVVAPSVTPEEVVNLLNTGKAFLHVGMEGSRHEGERWIADDKGRTLAKVVDDDDDETLHTNYRIGAEVVDDDDEEDSEE
jgi:hypothetical protein